MERAEVWKGESIVKDSCLTLASRQRAQQPDWNHAVLMFEVKGCYGLKMAFPVPTKL